MTIETKEIFKITNKDIKNNHHINKINNISNIKNIHQIIIINFKSL